MKVGQIYELTEEWFDNPTNTLIARLMPEFEAGALVEIIEIEEMFKRSQATAIRFVDTKHVHFVEQSPANPYTWAFFTDSEVQHNLLILKGESE